MADNFWRLDNPLLWVGGLLVFVLLVPNKKKTQIDRFNDPVNKKAWDNYTKKHPEEMAAWEHYVRVHSDPNAEAGYQQLQKAREGITTSYNVETLANDIILPIMKDWPGSQMYPANWLEIVNKEGHHITREQLDKSLNYLQLGGEVLNVQGKWLIPNRVGNPRYSAHMRDKWGGRVGPGDMKRARKAYAEYLEIEAKKKKGNNRGRD